MKMFLFDRNQKVKRWLADRDFIEAKMVEQINAADQLTFSVPLNKRLPSSYFYAAIPQPRGSGYLLFKIVTEKVSSDQIEYTAIESAYDELKSYHYIKDVRPENRKAGELLQTALEGTRWQVGQTYDSGTFSTNFYYISTLEAIQKIVELCGLEVTFEITLNSKTHQIEHRLVNLYAQQGQRTGKRFEYGSNLLTVEREESAENLITALIGRGKGEAVYHEDNTAEETPDGYGRRINFADVVWSKKNGNPADKPAGQEYVEDVDATAKYGFDDGKPRIGIEIFEDITDPAELLKATWSALQTLKRPQASFRASVMDVGDLGLGDTVAIVRHDIKIEYFTRVYKVTHNLLDERQNTIELGDDFSGSSITSTVNDLGKSVGTVERIANYAAVSANGKNANYYGQAQPINPMEGDLWYKDLGNGETDMYQYHAGNWILITSTRDLHNVEKQVKQAQDDFTTAWNKVVAADSSAAKAQQRADDVGKQLQSAQADFDSKLSAASASASAANDKAMQAANAAQNDVNAQIKELNDYKANAAKTYVDNSTFDNYKSATSATIDDNKVAADQNLNSYKDTVNKTYVAKGTVISNVNTEADASIFSTNNKLYMDAATTVFSGKAFIPDAAIIDLTASKLTAGTIDASKISVINLNASNINTGTLDASLIKAGSMSADRISGGTIDFSKVNAASLSADKITSGTLDAGNVNIINLNANNITSGTIKGTNLGINLNSGEVGFQHGRIHNSTNAVDIDLDNAYVSTASDDTRVILKKGEIQLVSPQFFDLSNDPYLRIYNGGTYASSNFSQASIVGRTGVTIAVTGYTGSAVNGAYGGFGDQSFLGLFIGKNADGTPTPVGLSGASSYVNINGGEGYGDIVKTKPSINVGIDITYAKNTGPDMIMYGKTISVAGDWVRIPSAYAHTTSASPNTFVAADGTLYQTTSAARYKAEIERSYSTDYGEKLLNVPIATWYDKAEMKRYASGESDIVPIRYFGMIAEDLDDAGLDMLVRKSPDGELSGINYDRIALALIPVIKNLKERIEALENGKQESGNGDTEIAKSSSDA